MRINGINYSRQKRAKDCGIAAVANALKWAGISINYANSVDYFAEEMQVDLQHGIFIDDYKQFFDEVTAFNTKYKKDPTLSEIKEHLKEGGAIVIVYQPIKDFGHAAFIIKDTDRSLYFVNHSTKTTLSELSYEKVEELLSRDSDAFFITKK